MILAIVIATNTPAALAFNIFTRLSFRLLLLVITRIAAAKQRSGVSFALPRIGDTLAFEDIINLRSTAPSR
jgi:hypothetical protein